MIFIELIYNIATLVALSVVSGFIDKRWRRETTTGAILQGFLFGFVALLGMILPLVLSPGLIFDGRSVVISLCGLFFGPISAVIAAVMAILLRLLQGGVGAVMGVSVITASALIGTLFFYYRKRNELKVTVNLLLLLGIIVHAVMLSLTLTLPYEAAMNVLQRVGLPIITIYPLATLLIGKILSDQEISIRSNEALTKSENLFRSVWEHSKDGMRLTDGNGTIVKVNDAFCRFVEKDRKELEGSSLKYIYSDYDRESIILSYLKNYQEKIITPYFEREFILWNGKRIWFEVTATYIYKESSTPLVLAVFRDISDRKFAEESMRDIYAKLNSLISSMNQGILLEDKNRNILFANSFFYKIFGIPEGLKLIDKDCGEIAEQSKFLFTDPENFILNVNRRVAEGKTIISEELFLRDGRVFERDYIPVYDNNLLQGSFWIYREITERKLSEISLKESKQMLRSVLDTIPVCVFWKDLNLNYIGCNKAFAIDAGVENPEDVIGKSDFDLIWADRAENFREDDRSIIESKKSKINYEEMQITPDGRKFWIILTKIPLIDYEGIVTGILGTYENITERKIQDNELRKLSSAVMQSPASIVITNLKGEIEFINPKVTEITGYTLEEIKGINPRIFNAGEIPNEVYTNLWQTITSEKEWRGEFHNKKKNGELFWEDASISPIKNEKGELTHYIAVKEDITSRKMMVKDLIAAKESAESANKAKSVFLANMSHEIRTPLIGILGYSELLESIANNVELKEMAEKINVSGQRLLSTLNSLLDLSVIESNKLQINISNLDAGSIIKECTGLYRIVAEKNNIELKVVLPDYKLIALGDEKLLNQVLNNLVSNAIKYTQEGTITVSAEHIKNENQNLLAIKVSDTGIGIPENALIQIFEPFRQVSEGFSREYEGTGLGLAISKKFVEAMKGTIEVKSEVGVGSTFIVNIPANTENFTSSINSDTKENIIKEEKKSARILVVEDDITSRDFMQLILRNIYDVNVAESGQKAIDLCSINKYDGILLDISLGKGMDGAETLKKIRSIEGYEKVPIAAVTAHAMTGHREMFLSKGFNNYISKPFSKKELHEFLEKMI